MPKMSLPLASRNVLTKTVAVLGASYGGLSAARYLAQELPAHWRVVVVDRNTHFNHLYVLPRAAVLPQHAYKAFIPYTGIFRGLTGSEGEDAQTAPRVVVLHAQVTGLSPHSATLSRSFPKYGIDSPVLDFDYAVYALGSHLPAPINLWGPSLDGQESVPYSGGKADGIAWLRKFHGLIEQAPSVLVVGGGALGIQYATDIAEVYPTKSVTLLHSRAKLLPRFDEAMHKEIIAALESLNITTILGERLDLASLNLPESKPGQTQRTVKTLSGREIPAGLVLLCTGQAPNTAAMHALLPESIVPDGASKGKIRVKRTLQVAVPVPAPTSPTSTSTGGRTPGEDDAGLAVPYPHLFAIGDAADAFGAINAGHLARDQALLASRNILTLIRASEAQAGAAEAKAKAAPPTLERYEAGPPGIKLSLGLGKGLFQRRGEVGKTTEVAEDLNAAYMWRAFGVDVDDAGMHL